MTTTQKSLHEPTVVPSTAEDLIADFAIAATLLVFTASIVAVGLGDPELLALVAVTGVVVWLGTRVLLSATEKTRALRS